MYLCITTSKHVDVVLPTCSFTYLPVYKYKYYWGYDMEYAMPCYLLLMDFFAK